MASRSYFSPRGLSASAADVQALLNRYPDIAEHELAGLIRAFGSLPSVDFGLMAADKHLGAKLDLFYAEHGDRLPRPFPGAIWAIPAVALMAVLVVLQTTFG